jgi:hypothetical protein
MTGEVNVDYRLMPYFKASWELAEAARATRGVPAATIQPRRERDAVSAAAAVAIQRWIEDDR